jgi:adenylate cyclase
LTCRLAAILAADAAVYSGLIGGDDEGTLDRLKSIRAQVIDPALAPHHGRLAKIYSDPALAR